MSGGFNFGGTAAGGGGTGFSFGAGATTKPNTGGTGFSFGGQPSQTPATTTQATSGFGFNAQSTQAKPGGFSFGTPTATTSAVPATGATPGFSFGTPVTPAAPTANSTPATAAPANTGLAGFGAQAASTATPSGGLTLGGLGKPQTTTAAFAFSTTASQQPTKPSTGLGGTTLGGGLGGTSLGSGLGGSTLGGGLGGGGTALGGGLGGGVKPTGTTQATAATGLSLNTAPATTQAAPAAGLTLGGTTAQVSTASGGLSFNLGGAKTTATTATTTSAPSLGGGLKLGGFGQTTSAATGTTLTGKPLAQPGATATATSGVALTTSTTTTSSAAAAPSMNYRQLEEEINKWSVQLDEQEKIFIQQATQVNAWDRLLIENGDKISELNTEVERVKLDQQRLDGELDFIQAQQRELEDMLAPLEAAVEQMPPITIQQHADLEREHTYKLAENIDAQLKRMVQDLKEIIDHMNSSQGQPDNNDPVQQIAKILNAHMHSLQWVDSNTALLQRRVDDVTKLAEHRKKEQERNFRLAYD